MTQQHARYLQNYPHKIALKRLKRRRMLRARKEESRMSVRHMREVLQKWHASHPQRDKIRVGSEVKSGIGTRIRNFFSRKSV